MEIFNTFGSMTSTLRKRRGFGQREFARLIGIPQPKLSAIEHERQKPPKDRKLLKTMAEKLRIDPDTWEWDQFIGLALRPGQLTEEEKKVLTSPVFLGLMSAVNRRSLKESEVRQLTKQINDSRKVLHADSDPQHE